MASVNGADPRTLLFTRKKTMRNITMKPFERAFRALVLSLAFAALGSVPRAAHANPPAYTLTDIVTLPGGTSSSSAGVSPSGQVTGGADTSDSSSHAFLSAPNGGAPKDLGTLPGSFYSTGFGVNASGQVAGGATVGPSLGFYLDTPKHAFLSGPHGGALQDLGTLPGGAGAAFAPASVTHCAAAFCAIWCRARRPCPRTSG